MRVLGYGLLALGCAAPTTETNQAVHATPYVVLSQDNARQIVGVIQQQMPDSDAPVVYEIFLQRGDELSPLPYRAADVSLSGDALAWLSASGELHLVSLASKTDRVIAQDVFFGVIARDNQVAYNVRVDGPESAVFRYDTKTKQTILVEDGVGSDELVALSPDGTQALLLSSRSGLSSLYRKNLKTQEIVQLTNVGLKLGPDLDTSQVTPNPINKNEVVWGSRGIAYRSQEGSFLLGFDQRVTRLASDASLVEAAQ